jgi:anti-sigma B factor antagonist
MGDRGAALVVRRDQGQVAVLSVRAKEVRQADTLAELGRQVRRAIEAGDAASFVLDLGEVEFLSSAALGLIINLRAHLTGRDYGFSVAAATSDVATVFRHAHLEKVLPLYATVEEAVRARCEGV